jgi:hypothetical protein
MASRNKRPINQYRIDQVCDDLPAGLICGWAETLDDARGIAEQWKPALIWDTWHRHAGPNGKRYYHPILVGWTTPDAS